VDRPSRQGASRDDLEWLYGGSEPAEPDPIYGPRRDTLPPADRVIPPAPRVVPPPNQPSRPVAAAAKTPSRPARQPRAQKPSPSRPAHENSAADGLSLGQKVKRIFNLVLVVLVLWLVFLVAAPVYALSRLPTIDDAPAGTRPPTQPGTAILLVGTDGRDALTPEEQEQLGTGGGGIGSRTDTMMIYYIPLIGKPALISLPRDSYLPIPGHDKNKLNAAYAIGGPSLLIETVEQATGVRIDGYLEVGFGGFVRLVDAVGGIEVCLDKPVVDANSNLNLPKGCQTLDGITTLGYVRQRYQDPLGDLGRVQRQREVIGKLLNKLATPSTVLNPVRYWRVCQALPSVLAKGKNTGIVTMANAARGAIPYSKGDAYSLTVPISNPNATTPAGSSVLWDDAKAKVMFGLIAKGTTLGLDQFAK